MRGLDTALRLAGLAMALAMLASCGSQRSRPRPVAVPVGKPQVQPAQAPVNSTGAVWRLRAGLNVAALTCRGRGVAEVAPGYRRLLSRHAALLAQVHAEEQRRQGVAGFDRAQTRYYNRMAFQRSPVRFCAAAAGIAERANALESPRLAQAAPGLAQELETALR